MTIVRRMAFLGAAAIMLCAIAPAHAGQPTSRGTGLGTAAATSGQSGSHVSVTPGQAAPTPSGFSLAPGQGTGTATTTPAGSGPATGKIGQGTTK